MNNDRIRFSHFSYIKLLIALFVFSFTRTGFAIDFHRGEEVSVILLKDSVWGPFFNNYPHVDSIEIEYKESIPTFLELYTAVDDESNEDHMSNRSFDLKFEGDRYILQQEYSNLLSAISKFQIDNINNIANPQNFDRLRVLVKKDTFSCTYIPRPFLEYASFQALDQLKEELENSYKPLVYVPKGDSVLIVQTIVNRDRTLGDIGLIVGEHSSFYEFVLRALRKTGATWQPMNNNGRPLRSVVDIYIRLYGTNSFSISLTGRGRKLQIKDNDKSSRLFF